MVFTPGQILKPGDLQLPVYFWTLLSNTLYKYLLALSSYFISSFLVSLPDGVILLRALLKKTFLW